MAFRTMEIAKPAEIHIRRGQLEVTNEDGQFLVPLEDLTTIVCSGANIRMSTLAQAQIAEAGISFMIIDEKYHPACVMLPFISNVRQSLVIRNQIALSESDKNTIWLELVLRKIENQSRALAILGKEGAEKVMHYSVGITPDNADVREANAAKEYFHHLHPGLNRRNDDPINSCLNYGYAVLRNAIIRSSILAGFQMSLGFHHDNYLNAFNLADDLIEPWRPFVDLIALRNPGNSAFLGKSKRKELAMVLHNTCLLHRRKMSVQSGIDEMIGSIRNRIASNEDGCIKLPILLAEEAISAIKE